MGGEDVGGLGDQGQSGQMSSRGISVTWDLVVQTIEEAEVVAKDCTVWRILTSQAASADMHDAD